MAPTTTGAAAAGDSTPHIAVLPTPGMGHLIPLAELAKRLVDRHGFHVTFITLAASASKAQQAYLDALPPSITSIPLPAVSLADLPADARIETVISVAALRSVPAVRSVLISLKSTANLVAFMADLFSVATFDAARDAGVPSYLFLPSNFMMTSLMLQAPVLDSAKDPKIQFSQLPEPVKLPGCVPIPGLDLLHPLQDNSNECYKWVVQHGARYREAEAILVNTFVDIEPWAKDHFFKAEPEPGWPAIYPVGPLIQSAGVGESDCLNWLDTQPSRSVLFVSFGSAGTLSMEQTAELAHGLELSGQRFLWVVRMPSDSQSGNFFTAGKAEDPFGFLPEGFVERTEGKGMVVAGWAPQVLVLGHESTVGFLSHCGWNSTLESMMAGVPLITWPLFAEQRQNAVMLAEGVRVALRLKAGEDGVYRKEEIARVVRELMEGEEGKAVRRRAEELMVAGATALAEGGSSWKGLNEVAEKWKKNQDERFWCVFGRIILFLVDKEALRGTKIRVVLVCPEASIWC